MGSFSAFHWIIVILVVVVIFGAGRLPSAMSDLAKGIRAFRSGMKDEQQAADAQRQAQPAGTINQGAATAEPVKPAGTPTGQPTA